jgi:hypothetical protein
MRPTVLYKSPDDSFFHIMWEYKGASGTNFGRCGQVINENSEYFIYPKATKIKPEQICYHCFNNLKDIILLLPDLHDTGCV